MSVEDRVAYGPLEHDIDCIFTRCIDVQTTKKVLRYGSSDDDRVNPNNEGATRHVLISVSCFQVGGNCNYTDGVHMIETFDRSKPVRCSRFYQAR
jgi:hypothetical protein